MSTRKSLKIGLGRIILDLQVYHPLWKWENSSPKDSDSSPALPPISTSHLFSFSNLPPLTSLFQFGRPNFQPPLLQFLQALPHLPTSTSTALPRLPPTFQLLWMLADSVCFVRCSAKGISIWVPDGSPWKIPLKESWWWTQFTSTRTPGLKVLRLTDDSLQRIETRFAFRFRSLINSFHIRLGHLLCGP